MISRAWAWRIAMTGVAALLLPACRGVDSPTVLFLDGFDGAFPGTAWTVSGTASAVKDVLNGFGTPPSSLRMSGTSASVTAATTASFTSPSVTFSAHMAADTASGTDAGTGTITLRHSVSGVVASASWNEATDLLTLTIVGATDVTIAAPASDLKFHRIVFKVDAAGTATWTLDNGLPLMSQTGFPAGLLTLELGATFPAGTTALFYFDNVHVLSP